MIILDTSDRSEAIPRLISIEWFHARSYRKHRWTCPTCPAAAQPGTKAHVLAQGGQRPKVADFYAWDSRMAGTNYVKHVTLPKP